jgi:MFS family permease
MASPKPAVQHGSRPPTAETLSLAARKLMPILLICYIFSFLDRTNIGFAKTHLEIDVGISAAAYGLGAGLFFLSYAALEIPSNLMLHRVGARFWIARIMVTWGTLSALMAVVKGPTSFYILRLLLGAAEAGLYPGVIYLISMWWPQGNRARMQGIFLIGACIASIVGAPLAGALMMLDGMSGLHGWQWMFILMGLPCVPFAVVVWKYLPDRPTRAPWLDPATAKELEDYIAAEDAAGAQQSGNHNIWAVLKDRQILLAVLAYMTNQLGVYTVVYFLPSIVAANGRALSTLQVGLLIAIPWICAAIGATVIPRLADRDRDPKRWMLISTTGMLVGLLIAVFGSPWVAFAGYCLVGLCFIGPQPLYFAHVGSRLEGAMLAVGLAAVNTFGLFGGFLGPTVMGKLQQMTGQATGGLWFVIAIQVLGLLLISYLKPRTAAQAAPLLRVGQTL